jgi:hypothetical protein
LTNMQLNTPTVPVMVDVPQIFLWAFGIAVTIVGYFIVRTLKQIDRNQNELFDKLNGLRSEFDLLKGEHQVLACKNIGSVKMRHQ